MLSCANGVVAPTAANVKLSIAKPSSLPPSSASTQRIAKVCPGIQLLSRLKAEVTKVRFAVLFPSIAAPVPVTGDGVAKSSEGTVVNPTALIVLPPTLYEKYSLLGLPLPPLLQFSPIYEMLTAVKGSVPLLTNTAPIVPRYEPLARHPNARSIEEVVP